MEIASRYLNLLRMVLFSLIVISLYSCGGGSSGGVDSKLGSSNLLTVWAEKRASVLVNNGKSSTVAMKQSEKELTTLFGIKNIHELNINQPEKFPADNALLLLLSGALTDVAHKYSINEQLIINDISHDFSINGKLTDKGDTWFSRMQAMIRDNPKSHLDQYTKYADSFQHRDRSLPTIIPLASRPVAIASKEVFAKPGESIFLDASASHDNNSGNLINYTWFRIDQQKQFTVPLSDRFSNKPSIRVPNQETDLLFAIVVTDEEKLTDTAIVHVKVRKPPKNTPPVADSQTIETNEDTPVDIILTGSDADLDSVLSFVIDTPLLLPNGILEGAVPNLTYTPTANFFGTDSFTFKVNDGFEDSLAATIDIIVKPINDQPVADAGISQSVKEAETVVLSGSGSDLEDGSNISYEWTAPDDITLDNPSSSSPSFVAPAVSDSPVVYTFTLLVRDSEGLASAADSVSITVSHENLAPLANAGKDQTVEAGAKVFLHGSGVDPEDGDNVSYEWTAPDGIALDDPHSATPSFIAPDVSDTPITLVFTLVVKDTQELTSFADSVKITVKKENQAPTANAGFPQTVIEGTRVYLSGSGSDPEDKGNVTFQWIAPHGILLTNPNSARPSFIAPAVGSFPRTLIFSLIVKDTEGLASLPATVRITVKKDNKPPKADAGEDQTVIEGAEVILHGSGFDPEDGENVTFRWIASAGISLKNSNTATPSFIAPTLGEAPLVLGITLIVSDSQGLFALDTVKVTVTANHAPIANAGADQTGKVGDTIQLDGSASSDLDGDTLTYQWSFIEKPAGSDAILDSTEVSPSFDIDRSGIYIARLIVNDGQVNSIADTIKITTLNSQPIAIAKISAPLGEIHKGDGVFLGGYDSYDPDSDPITYKWSLLAPNGNEVTLNNPNTVEASFHPTQYGNYKARLIVNDGRIDSDQASIEITVVNQAPTADAGDNKSVYGGEVVTLYGNGIDSEDGDNVTFEWTAPSGITLANPASSNPSFTAPYGGNAPVELKFILIVRDTQGLPSAPSEVIITVYN